MKPTYSEKLKDPRWQKKRLEIMERDGWACRLCGDKDKTLHVHHGCYERGKEPWEYHPDSLWTLCHECHDETQSGLDFLKQVIGALRPAEVRYFREAIGARLDYDRAYGIAVTPRNEAEALLKMLSEEERGFLEFETKP